MTHSLQVQIAGPFHFGAVWEILEPVIRAGETYPLARDMERREALKYWFSPNHQTFVAVSESVVVGTYYLRPNNPGGGSHIANCGFITANHARGQGVARTMCCHALELAATEGYLGMQFNFVVANNYGAISLWSDMGFEITGRQPKAFNHPKEGLVDALVMFRELL
jgi:ribosomal protein S18 acetylase RimI-like enzyme